MKTTSQLSISALAFLTMVASALAQAPSPRDEFQSAVTTYQKAPSSAAALKVIQLYKQLDPPPGVPEEARRPFVMGSTMLKRANDPDGATKAAGMFTEAINTAPWFADAYYNRALAREIAGQFAEAMDDLKLYLVFALSESEHRDAQDKIYSLEADAQLRVEKKNEDQRLKVAQEKTDLEKASAAKIEAFITQITQQSWNVFAPKGLKGKGITEDEASKGSAWEWVMGPGKIFKRANAEKSDYRYLYPEATDLDHVVFLDGMASIMSRAGGTPQQVLCFWLKVNGPSWYEIEFYFRNRSGVTGRAWAGNTRGGASLYLADDAFGPSHSKTERCHYLLLEKAN